MKTIRRILTAATLLAFTGSALADATIKAGPRKGRLLEVDKEKAEFFVEKDRTISIAFYRPAKQSWSLRRRAICSFQKLRFQQESTTPSSSN